MLRRGFFKNLMAGIFGISLLRNKRVSAVQSSSKTEWIQHKILNSSPHDYTQLVSVKTGYDRTVPFDSRAWELGKRYWITCVLDDSTGVCRQIQGLRQEGNKWVIELGFKAEEIKDNAEYCSKKQAEFEDYLKTTFAPDFDWHNCLESILKYGKPV